MKQSITDIFKAVYDETSEGIYKFCKRRVANAQQAQDLTQEVFLRFWKSLSMGETIQNTKAYVYTITRRLIIDWYRKKKPVSLDAITEGGVADTLPDEQSFENLETQPEGRRIVETLNTLPPQHRHILQLRFLKGLTPKEIAAQIGTSANAVSIRITKALTTLKQRYTRTKDNTKIDSQ